MNKKWVIFSAIMNTILIIMDSYLFIAYLFIFLANGDLVNLTCSLLSLALIPFWAGDLVEGHKKLKKIKELQEGD